VWIARVQFKAIEDVSPSLYDGALCAGTGWDDDGEEEEEEEADACMDEEGVVAITAVPVFVASVGLSVVRIPRALLRPSRTLRISSTLCWFAVEKSLLLFCGQTKQAQRKSKKSKSKSGMQITPLRFTP
jgi:hypothetical protein